MEYKDFVQAWLKLTPLNTRIRLARDADKVNNRGFECYNNGDINGAIQHFTDALNILPMNDDAIRNLIICYEDRMEDNKVEIYKQKLNYLKEIGYCR